MAAGKSGVQIALLVFQILYGFLQPVDTRLDFITSPCVEDHYGQILVGTEDANIPIFNYGDEYFYNHLLSLTQSWRAGADVRGMRKHYKQSKHPACPIGERIVTVNRNKWLFSISLLISGDVHPCPGPVRSTTSKSKKPRYPCVRCGGAVRGNSRAVSCDGCDEWTHLSCSAISTREYRSSIITGAEISHTCNRCILLAQPLFGDAEEERELKEEDSGFFPSESDPKFFDCFKSKGLHFLHLNARSLLPKIEELRLVAQNSHAAVIGITETWLDHSVTDHEIIIPNYTVIRKDRNREGGGVCMYIRTDLAFNQRNDISDDQLEMLWIELLLPHTRHILICTCYRPQTTKNFYDILENVCTQKDRVLDLECFLLGDLNSDFSKTQSPLYQALKHFLYICNWVQVIKEPTRITPTCSSILDVIIVSDEEKISQSGVIPIGISDHFLTYCTRHSPKTKFNKHNTIRSRSMKNYSTEIFNEKLSEINWFKVINCDDVDVAWSNFKDLFMSVVDKIAPLKEKRLKQRSEPWITSELLDDIRARDQALEIFGKIKLMKFINIFVT